MYLIEEQEQKKRVFLKVAKKEQIEKIIKKNEEMQLEKEKLIWDKFEEKDQKVLTST